MRSAAAVAGPPGVPPVGLTAAVATVAGAACGLHWDTVWLTAIACVAAGAGWAAWVAGGVPRLEVLLLGVGFFCAASALGADARQRALATPLRAALDREAGGFAIDTSAVTGASQPVATRAVLVEDAALGNEVASLRVRAIAIRLGGTWRPTQGGVVLTVGGPPPAERVAEWRAGRIVETFVAFRRPSRYLNDGVADFERQLALDGTTLFGSVKSALLVEVRSRGSAAQEAAARARAFVRERLSSLVAPHGAVPAAIVTAILIGDRTGLPDEVRVRLQEAGTYHVMAISGGNIAILTVLVMSLLAVCGIGGRLAAVVTLAVLAAYAYLVTAGPSVWRATFMAALYLAARLLDHRSPPWHAIALAAAATTWARPLDVRNVGFVLTFGATASLLGVAQWTAANGPRLRAARWLLASVLASAAVEVVLLPVSAWAFSRATAAGLVLNLAAVPLMGVVQVAGIVVCLAGHVEPLGRLAGWVAYAAAVALVESARLLDWAPWLTARVPPPPWWIVAGYYAGLTAAIAVRRAGRAGGLALLAASAAAILSGQPGGWLRDVAATRSLRVTALDVGQGDATLVEFPDRSTLLVDAGGLPFGGRAFDVGGRVVSPALWARGLRRLDALLLTHGDPDHIGGAAAVIGDFEPAEIWQGIPVASHDGLLAVERRAQDVDAVLVRRVAGDERRAGGVSLRVLHPPPPDWERPRVRNDDSVVLELRYGDVAVLLLGDVGAAVERALLPQLSRARIRILKVGHHGSRTSTSPELLERWRPQIALVSCGRGNAFGHPDPEVLRRLASIGAAVYRTDRDGQVTVAIDRDAVRVTTYMGEKR